MAAKLSNSSKAKLNNNLRKSGIIELSWYDRIQDSWICLVDPNMIKVDPAYQRPHDEHHSDSLAGVHCPVTPYPICGISDDRPLSLDAYDGQHRVESAKTKKLVEIYVVVKFGLSLAQRALLYADLQTTKRPPLWNVFNARVSGGDSKYMNMKQIANDNGLSLRCDSYYGDLRNVAVMKEATTHGLYESWIKLLCAFKRESGALERKAAYGAIDFQRGLLDLIKKYGNQIVNPQVIKILRECGADFIHTQSGKICRCARANRGHFMQAFESQLVLQGIIKTLKRKAA